MDTGDKGEVQVFEEIGRFSEETPGAGIAAVGLGACLLVREANILSASTNIPVSFDTSIFFSALALTSIIMALVYRYRPSFRIYRHPVLAGAITACVALAAIISFGSVMKGANPAFDVALNTLFQVGANLLLLMWGETLYPYGVKRIAYVLAFGCITSAGMAVLLMLFRTDMEYGAIAILPVISLICLYYFNEYNSSRSGFLTRDVTGVLRLRTTSPFSCPVFSSWKSRLTFIAITAGSFFLYRFAVGKVSFTWVPVLSASGASSASQLSNAVGMLLAGCIIIVFVRFFWQSHSLGTYTMLIFVVLVLALYLALTVPWGNVVLCIIPLNIGQKLILLPILAAPYVFPTRRDASPFVMEALALALCALGSTCYSLVFLLLPEPVGAMLVGLSLVLLLVAAFMLINYDQRSDLQPEKKIEDVLAVSRESQNPTGDCNERALRSIAQTYQLTRREQDIVGLLVERYTASDIAEILVITVATAKTHMRNTYAKLDVHSQKELIALYNEFDKEQ